ncbi:hypothetical protein HYE82_04740 [Streptomyces sp. BR123]|uniref:hypothetical protein n=1 Tax=Streptomyces sp. BR123 TaxID=2749828 RepID=UPI0015C4CC9E|nr:hypothetical protein [Streptomyces sp. BR123]NXY93718.1 hypothetical protein [Streptomyces sp. BR123]
MVEQLNGGGKGSLDGAVEASGRTDDEQAGAVFVEEASEASFAVLGRYVGDLAKHVEEEVASLGTGRDREAVEVGEDGEAVARPLWRTEVAVQPGARHCLWQDGSA